MSLDKIYKQLFSTVELKSEVIELAVTDDIKKLMLEAVNNKNIYGGDAEKAVAAIKKAKLTATDWRLNLQDAQKKIIELESAAKGLGIDIPKEISDYRATVKKGIDDVSKAITKLNDLQMVIPIL